MSDWLPYIFCVLGSLICFLNLYTSFGRRYWIAWRQGIASEEVGHVSGAPMIGSLLAVLGAFALPDNSAWFYPVLLIALFDTGGLHVFIAVMVLDRFRN